jgi:hypothetical protein
MEHADVEPLALFDVFDQRTLGHPPDFLGRRLSGNDHLLHGWDFGWNLGIQIFALSFWAWRMFGTPPPIGQITNRWSDT